MRSLSGPETFVTCPGLPLGSCPVSIMPTSQTLTMKVICGQYIKYGESFIPLGSFYWMLILNHAWVLPGPESSVLNTTRICAFIEQSGQGRKDVKSIER